MNAERLGGRPYRWLPVAGKYLDGQPHMPQCRDDLSGIGTYPLSDLEDMPRLATLKCDDACWFSNRRRRVHETGRHLLSLG
jgi:hypothetical protein